MKLAITIGALLLAACSFGQSDSQRWEDARYEMNVNNKIIYFFEVQASNHEFSNSSFESLKNEFLNKEGIIDVKMINSKQIYVYTYDLIDIDVVKSIFVIFDSEIELLPRKRITLNQLEQNFDK